MARLFSQRRGVVWRHVKEISRNLLVWMTCSLSVFGQSTGACYPPFSPPVSPTLTTYVGSLQYSLSAIQSQIAGLSQPKIQLDGQDVYAVAGQMYAGMPCQPIYPSLGTGNCPYDDYNVQEAAINYLYNSGVRVVDISIGVLPLEASSEYQMAWGALFAANGWSATPLLTSDCYQNGTLTFTLGSNTVVPMPANAGPWCKTLAVWDDIINQAHSKGMIIRLAPTPSTEQSPCLLTTGGTLPTSDNSGQLDKCYGPLYYAAILRWRSMIDSITVLHEPSGVWSNSTVFLNQLTVRNFIKWCYPNLQAAALTVSSTIAVGAAAVTSMNGPQDAAYWADWITNLAPLGMCPGGTRCMDYFALDVYPITWDAQVYGTAGGLWLCSANSSAPGSPCLSTWVLSSCSPSTLDTNDDCEWFVPSALSLQSGEVLSGTIGTITGASPPAGVGTCTYGITDGGPRAAGGVLLLSYSGSSLTWTVLNVGSGFTAIPTQASLQSWTGAGPCGSMINLASWPTTTLAAYANGGPLSLASSLASSARTAGEPVRINEANRPTYVKTNCGPSGARGIFDNDFAEWGADGMDMAWLGTIAVWASANGFTSISPFATQMWAWYNSVDVNAIPPCSGSPGSNNCTSAFPDQKPYLNQISISGLYWSQTAAWVDASLQGNAQLTGKFALQ